MIARRDVIMGSACAIAAGAAYALKPSRRVSLLEQATVDEIVPRQVGKWTARDVGNLVAPVSLNSLEAKLYGEVVERVYRDASSQSEIMMLMAHGDTQTNDLQLHRPEVCYPAFGFEILTNLPAQLKLPAAQAIPVRRIIAEVPGRRETILYWTRLGEFMPIDGAEQRFDRLKTAMEGYIVDGLLARFSSVGPDSQSLFAALEQFVPALISAVPADKRSALIGTPRAQAISAAGV